MFVTDTKHEQIKIEKKRFKMQGKNTEMKMSVSTEGHPSAEVHSVHSSRPLLE